MQYMPSFMREKYEEGREEGEITAMATLLLGQLKEKFNAIPDWAIKKIEGAKAETLNKWAINIVKKGTIDEVLS